MGNKDKIRDFIVKELLSGDSSRLGPDDESLYATRVVDSTGMIDLVMFLEKTFGITISDDEILPENLDNINAIDEFVTRKQS